MTSSIPTKIRLKNTLLSLLELFDDFITEYSDLIIGFNNKSLYILKLYTTHENSHILLTSFLDRSYDHWNSLYKKDIHYLVNNVEILVDSKYKKYVTPLMNMFLNNNINIRKSYYTSIWNHTHAAIRICIHHLYNNTSSRKQRNITETHLNNLALKWNTNINYTPIEETLDDSSSVESDSDSSKESSSVESDSDSSEES